MTDFNRQQRVAEAVAGILFAELGSWEAAVDELERGAEILLERWLSASNAEAHALGETLACLTRAAEHAQNQVAASRPGKSLKARAVGKLVARFRSLTSGFALTADGK